MSHYFIKIDGKNSGPHSVSALQEMASLRAFDESALVTPEFAEDWKSVREIPELHIALFPPRKTMQFKAKPFESVPQTGEPISVGEILRGNLDAEGKKVPPRLPVARRPDRRRRDFLTSAILLNAAIGASYYFLPRIELIKTVSVSAAVLMTAGLYWLFYQVMDRH